MLTGQPTLSELGRLEQSLLDDKILLFLVEHC